MKSIAGSIPARHVMFNKIILTLFLLLIPSFCFSQDNEDEWTKYIVSTHPNLFILGDTLWDNTRPDMYVKTDKGKYVPVEVDWADRKWMEAFSQSAWYAKALNADFPVIVLLSKDLEKERDDLLRVKALQEVMTYKNGGWTIYLYNCKTKTFIKGW